MEETIAGTRTLSDTWVLTEPTTLRGSPGACIEGHARDALIRVRAPVTIENLEIRRVARPDGTPSWGSLIVVEPGGELIVSGCRLEGAAHGHIVERGATLGPGEAWVHAGVDVRGTGRAVVQKGEFLQCCLGTLASVYPRTAYLNLEVDACRFEGCAGAVQVSAAGRGSARKSVARGPGAVAYYLQDGELALERCEARDLDTGIAANAGKLKVRGGRVERARVGIRCDGNGVAAARDCTIEGSTGVAAAAAGLGSLELRDCTVAAGAGNGLEVVGAARLDARGGSVEVASAALLALDA
ncbi:MAG: hypothetical protein FJ102_23790, partial [Deltaproteobacteria bacterium]|nr:hypothetical protein [Deltaproteobacteria bacterium]